MKRTGIVLKPNSHRVVIKPFDLPEHRAERILGRVATLTEIEVDLCLAEIMQRFAGRHQQIQRFFQRRYEQLRDYLLTDRALSQHRQLLMGAYFTQEYALESAALFNPSMIWHYDQSGLLPGWRRFILSLRATGEGHISSITFRSGTVDPQNQIHLDEPTKFVTAPELEHNTHYEKSLFARKLIEVGIDSPFATEILSTLDTHYTMEEIQHSIERLLHEYKPRRHELEPVACSIITLLRANYELSFNADLDLSERIILPSSPTETNGIEDARFIAFNDGGVIDYYATYTAYDGKVIIPQILETRDFVHFKASTLNGPEVSNKGFALFPRKLHGQYAMLSRQDGENLYLMYSDMLHFWYTKELVAKPAYNWEFVQLGNCGSPIETEAGWLVLTHGVGAMRKYSMGAFLLDLEDPSKLIGRLREPLLEPNDNEREGYVPNVVYSCGAVLHNQELIIPYAMSDYVSTFATVPLDQVLDAMV